MEKTFTNILMKIVEMEYTERTGLKVNVENIDFFKRKKPHNNYKTIKCTPMVFMQGKKTLKCTVLMAAGCQGIFSCNFAICYIFVLHCFILSVTVLY